MTTMRSITRALLARLWLVAVAFIVVTVGVTVAVTIPLLTDHPLNPDLVSAQRLRVNTTALKALDAAINAYHTPPPVSPAARNPWQTAAPLPPR